jgi:hypothetical protein
MSENLSALHDYLLRLISSVPTSRPFSRKKFAVRCFVLTFATKTGRMTATRKLLGSAAAKF